MLNAAYRAVTVMLLALALVGLAPSGAGSQPLIVTHACTDTSEIPETYIDAAQAGIKLHYAHTSHGGQLTTGLSRIEAGEPAYSVAIGYRALPSEPGALCIFDGQEHDTYITPDEYWETHAGMDYTRDVLNNYPTINVSMWSWCTQLDYYSQAQCQAYIDSISSLEAEFPGVTFVYMTCNAQGTGSSGYNRYVNNEMIRQHCIDNDKVLFDFADLDVWWYNPATPGWEFSSYDYGGTDVPVEHPHFNGNEAGHTTYESCEQKGKAVWHMVARLAGWRSDSAYVEPHVPDGPDRPVLIAARPNPFSGSTSIRFAAPACAETEFKIIDVSGRCVCTLHTGAAAPGARSVLWDGRDDGGRELPSGVYFCCLSSSGALEDVEKLVLLR